MAAMFSVRQTVFVNRRVRSSQRNVPSQLLHNERLRDLTHAPEGWEWCLVIYGHPRLNFTVNLMVAGGLSVGRQRGTDVCRVDVDSWRERFYTRRLRMLFLILSLQMPQRNCLV